MLELCVKVKLYSKHHALAKVNVMKYLVFIFFFLYALPAIFVC